MTPLAQAAAVCAIVLGTGAATVTAIKGDVVEPVIPDAPWALSTALDGRTFYTVDIVQQTGEVLEDQLIFKDGTFQSAMCQKYCDFGWTPYQTWSEGDTVHFTATTTCPDAPHRVVWHGAVTGDDVSFEATWTTRRWYWTHQINAIGSGSVTPPAGEAPTG